MGLDVNPKDMSIMLTRGDVAYLSPRPYYKTDPPTPYEFQQGDRVIFRVQMLPGVGEVLRKECEVDVEKNTCTLTLLNDDTKDLEEMQYNYDIELLQAGDTTKPQTFLAKRKFIVEGKNG